MVGRYGDLGAKGSGMDSFQNVVINALGFKKLFLHVVVFSCFELLFADGEAL
jgi:hypothetical protein